MKSVGLSPHRERLLRDASNSGRSGILPIRKREP
jgi:hypothetical protein